MDWVDGCPLDCRLRLTTIAPVVLTIFNFKKWFGCGLVIVDRAVDRTKQKSNWLHASLERTPKSFVVALAPKLTGQLAPNI